MTGATAVGERLTIELDGAALERLDALSGEDGCSRSEAARTLIEEGLRMAKHPGIVFHPGPTGRRASLSDGPDVWELAYSFVQAPLDTDEDAEALIFEIAGMMELSYEQVRTALRYYLEYGDEIRERMRRNDEESERGYEEWLRKRKAAS